MLCDQRSYWPRHSGRGIHSSTKAFGGNDTGRGLMAASDMLRPLDLDIRAYEMVFQ